MSKIVLKEVTGQNGITITISRVEVDKPRRIHTCLVCGEPIVGGHLAYEFRNSAQYSDAIIWRACSACEEELEARMALLLERLEKDFSYGLPDDPWRSVSFLQAELRVQGPS